MSEQPKALAAADAILANFESDDIDIAAAELRRQHAEIERLREALSQMRAWKVLPRKSITLEAIKAAQDQLAEMIASFEAATAAAPDVLDLPATTIELRPGERYAGLILDDDGTPSHHVILLPGNAESLSWENAKVWAAKAGGKLPSRREQSLLFANLKNEFQGAWYWSGELYSESSAWHQNFRYGGQSYDAKGYEARARAVRLIQLTA